MDAASRPGNIGFVTCPQLAEVFQGVGLKLAGVEIELLATGMSNPYKLKYTILLIKHSFAWSPI